MQFVFLNHYTWAKILVRRLSVKVHTVKWTFHGPASLFRICPGLGQDPRTFPTDYSS